MRFNLSLQDIGQRVRDYLLTADYGQQVRPDHLQAALLSYLRSGGKALRPALLLWSCGAVGGEEESALPAAAALEVYHTWTLVHDDIIDRDDRRRGGPTVHEQFRQQGSQHLGLADQPARHYGLSLAILTGDVQHGWAISLLSQLSDSGLALSLIQELETKVLTAIAEGETLDLQYSLLPIEQVSEDEIIKMLSQKTAALFRFTAQTGALIGLGSYQPDHPLVQALADFGFLGGIAFQLQDDLLGVLGKDEDLGKPVGSDLREGKRTTIVRYAWQQADPAQREQLLSVLGNQEASAEQVRAASALLEKLGGIAHTRRLAQDYGERAMAQLDSLSAGPYRDRLAALGQALVERRR